MLYRERTHNTTAIKETASFISLCDAGYICGHNFVDFDLEILKETSLYELFKSFEIIDTLPLSLLLFNEKSIHALPKNYKSEDDFRNDPVEDSRLTASLLGRLEERFLSLESDLRDIFYSLLHDKPHFKGFLHYMKSSCELTLLSDGILYQNIVMLYNNVLADAGHLKAAISDNPVELAYIIALLTPHIEIKSHPPRILYAYPGIIALQKRLCFSVEQSIDTLSDFAKEVFGFGTFRFFPKLNPTLLGPQSISQREVIEAALRDESFLTVLPTGGGKTFTFWLPAIIKAKAYKSLTVVISPLQALIEDHIKSFNSRVANFKAVAISSYLSPLERADAIEQIVNGEADILYLAPESLRSNMIFNILKNRLIERFVIDEAHCLSTWGNDFRQDYYYICEYIADLLAAKGYQEHIPVSCFTATAKPSVIADIREYFRSGLGIELDEYIAIPERKNLHYKSISSNRKDKYTELLKLINEHQGSTLVYIPSSTRECDTVAEKLSLDTRKIVRSFHSRLDSEEKMRILKEYILDEIDVIVATTAFGMGVDKANITNVIHYEMSDSLENYAQEAGRGARDQELEAFCPILYDESDMDKHFVSLNRSKITANEINSVFRVIKKTKGDIVTKTDFEIAREAGWDVEDDSYDYATKIKTALLELEREGYISRKRNKTRYFADSVARGSMEKLHEALESSPTLDKADRELLVIVLQTILGRGKSPVIQVDELAYLLGYPKEIVSYAIQRLKEFGILGDSKDLSLRMNKDNISLFHMIRAIEERLLKYLGSSHTNLVTIKELSQYLHNSELFTEHSATRIRDLSAHITDLLKSWRERSTFLFKRINRQNDQWQFEIYDLERLTRNIGTKHAIAQKALDLFASRIEGQQKVMEIEFSLVALRKEIGEEYSIKEIDKTLLYLHIQRIVELLNGRFISYTPMEITKEEKSHTKRKYTHGEYQHRLAKHYITKTESIHIMGEYAKRLQGDGYKAGMFLKDYFTLSYDEFKKKYNLLREKITRPISQLRYEKIFSQMSPEQKLILEDRESKAMMILAGPGSGKTRVLVHKIASLILTEDIKPEQFMMLTFSRTAASEFRSRLNQLIGVLSYEIEISTFHAYALRLIGRVARKEDDEILKSAIEEATRQIENGDITLPYKSVLVLDEYQDINAQSFALIQAIHKVSEKEMRVIAVGDDDQCIMEYAGANINFIDRFEEEFGDDDEGTHRYRQYELLTNFRSKGNIVNYTNDFISRVGKRYKQHPLRAASEEEGIVSVHTCASANLITPAVDMIKSSSEIGDSAILAYTNDEVMQIYSLLWEAGIGAKFIIERDKFALRNIIEIVEFDKTINAMLGHDTFYTEEIFARGLQMIESRFRDSKNLPLLRKVVDRFLLESQEYYVSQWLAYLDEIRLEEFEEYGDTVTVSTIHKSKGMEFERVIVLVNENPTEDRDKRLYYVGMTRAKSELTILRHGSEIRDQKPFARYAYDPREYPQEQKVVTLVMGLSDVRLGYTGYQHFNDFPLIAGSGVGFAQRDKCKTLGIICRNRIIGCLSDAFHKRITAYFAQGYRVEHAVIDYAVVWSDRERTTVQPLCKVVLKR